MRPCNIRLHVKDWKSRRVHICFCYTHCVWFFYSVPLAKKTNCLERYYTLPKKIPPPQTQEQGLQFYQELNRCGSFPLLCAPHSLFCIWTDLKRSWKIPGSPAWWRGDWISLTGPSGLHWNSPEGFNISSIRGFSLEQKSGSPNHPSPPVLDKGCNYIEFYVTR